ncbi:hypothetical protein [Bradyrhizobium embrapense]
MISTDTSSVPAGYDPFVFGHLDDEELEALPSVSPELAKPDSPFEDDADIEQLEDDALAEGMTLEQLEAAALRDDLEAAALETAIVFTTEAMDALIDPETGFVFERRTPGQAAPRCKYVRMSFRLRVLCSTISRLKRRAQSLRRSADRLMKAEAKVATPAREAHVQSRTPKRATPSSPRGGCIARGAADRAHDRRTDRLYTAVRHSLRKQS